MGNPGIDIDLDELDELVDVVEVLVERRDADGEVDVWTSSMVVVEHLEHVVRRLAAFRDERHGVRCRRHARRHVADVKRRRIPAKYSKVK